MNVKSNYRPHRLINKYLSWVSVKSNGKKGMIAIDQIRTIDTSRIIKTFDKLTSSKIRKLKDVFRETLVDKKGTNANICDGQIVGSLVKSVILDIK